MGKCVMRRARNRRRKFEESYKLISRTQRQKIKIRGKDDQNMEEWKKVENNTVFER
jgi:hypothetical protein